MSSKRAREIAIIVLTMKAHVSIKILEDFLIQSIEN